MSRDVQQRLFAIRTVPFNSLSERLYRILRKTARDLDKRANLEIHGAQTELDRSVLEKLVGPLEHLLRNALDHGIESGAARVAAGKSETGEIELTVRQVGNEIAIELSDDGRGIDFERVRERAVALGLLAADSEPTIHQLVECLFHPGFTTASEVTQISGRGIGMDVVRNEIVALGGRVDVHTQPGKGTRFNLFLPLTLAVAQSVLVRAGDRMWAIPAPMVEQVQQIKADVLKTLYADGQVHWQGRAWPFHYLPRLLGDNGSIPQTGRYNAVLLIRSGQGTAAIHVDEMIGNQEVVVKNIGPQLARVPGISGATVLGTGEIVLIINPVQLAQRSGIVRYHPSEDERITDELRRAAAASARKLVMVVDDSLTVRKFTTRLLTREGLRSRDGPRRHRCAEAADRAHARRDPARHRDAADGRLRVRQDDQGRREDRQHTDHHDHVTDGRQASQPGRRARRRAVPGQALPGGRTAAEPSRRHHGRGRRRQGGVDDAALSAAAIRVTTTQRRIDAAYGVCIGRGGRVTGSHSIRSYSAITCAPISSTSAAISSDSSTTIAVVSDP